ncbi:transmembrane protein PMIS2-like [Oryctolagus cuniculus]|uniref:transmembrane protein PMIS2-like n=1 Tax=Oryctolagus cuniculus TaxID=9986 RepID=UPI0038798D56
MQQATPLSTPEQPVTLVPLRPKPKDYLFLSIMSIFFFSPLAILALVFSLKTREANFLDNRERALKNSRLAFCFSIFSMLIGCALVTFYFVLRALKQNI